MKRRTLVASALCNFVGHGWKASAFLTSHACNCCPISSLLPCVSTRMENPHLAATFGQQLGKFEPLELETGSDEQNERSVICYDFVSMQPHHGVKCMPFREAWNLQQQLVQDHLERSGKHGRDQNSGACLKCTASQWARNQSSWGCDTVIILMHDPVFTLGTASDTRFLKCRLQNPQNTTEESIDIVRIERGGEVTYHGPGQLVVYPVFDLRGYKQDIHWYMRALEETIIVALKLAGIEGVRQT